MGKLTHKIDKCAICGECEAMHHEFIPVEKPDGCVCNFLEWGNPAKLPPICDSFVGNHSKNCEKCEHDYECHLESKSK